MITVNGSNFEGMPQGSKVEELKIRGISFIKRLSN
jgi:hypothetical protein